MRTEPMGEEGPFGGATGFGHKSSMRRYWSSRQPLFNGIATDFGSTGAGDHAIRES
jgi:hypothetical protein